MVHSDIGGKYYGRYDKTECNPRPFVNYLQECSIATQYTMSGTPQLNVIAEMRNRTLLHMV